NSPVQTYKTPSEPVFLRSSCSPPFVADLKALMHLLFELLDHPLAPGHIVPFVADAVAEGKRGPDGNDTWVLTENAYLDTTGLSIGPKGSDLTFEYRGDKKTLQNIQLVFSYTASVS